MPFRVSLIHREVECPRTPSRRRNALRCSSWRVCSAASRALPDYLGGGRLERDGRACEVRLACLLLNMPSHVNDNNKRVHR